MNSLRLLYVRFSFVIDIVFHTAITLLLGILAVCFTVGLLDIVMFYVSDVFYRDMETYKKIPVLMMLVFFPSVFTYKMVRFVLNIPSEMMEYVKITKEVTGFKIQGIIKKQQGE
ncbi:hypothetical protein [Halomonas sp. AOP35-4E-18]|uniref:hypothetical protein n=1 Tax=Halomonas sp. AOP35-4E-18 TaxID=3457686 RepID=UPI004034EF71